MKSVTRSILAAAGLLLGATIANAQPAVKVVVVDMLKIYDTHYKTEEANVKFNEYAQRAEEQLEQVNKQIQDIAKDYQELAEQARNTVLNQAARDKAQADAQKKGEDFQRLQAEAQKFRLDAQRSLQTRAKNHRDLIMDEILKVVNDIARTKGATLVLDKSGPSVFGVPVVLHADPAYDITEEVVREVNKDRPPAPAGGTAPSPGAAAPKSSTTTPASTPTFTVPGLSPPANNNPPAPTTPPKK
jgi:outer membrane protein